MICAADTIGVFQIESRAQMSMLPRLRPRCYYDLVIEVAIVRPGPIQGQMVHPYLRRRNGEEPVTYPDEKVERILGKTLGVPLFQEQAMQLAIECAGFTPDEADALRRAVTGFKHVSAIQAFGEKIVGGMLERGYDRGFAERCFQQIQGFSTYGFPESHAASFALLAYASAYLKCHHPAAFCCALLNSQPMGFYAPAQLVQDAQRHGVTVLPVDVNLSGWECSLEEGTEGRRHGGTEGEERHGGTEARRHAGKNQVDEVLDTSCLRAFVPSCLRLGLNRVTGLREDDARKIEAAVQEHGSFQSIETLWRSAGCTAAAMRRLAAADAFNSMGLGRQQALWEARKLKDVEAPLYERHEGESSRHGGIKARRHEGGNQSDEVSGPSCLRASVPSCLSLPPLPPLRHVVQDYAATGVTLRPHPMSFLRGWLSARFRNTVTAAQLADENAFPQGKAVAVAGLCLVRQRPGTARNITFMTLEDETGTANLVVFPNVFDRHLRVARHAHAMLVHGTIDRQGAVVHVKARRFTSLDDRLADLRDTSRNFH